MAGVRHVFQGLQLKLGRKEGKEGPAGLPLAQQGCLEEQPVCQHSAT